MKSLRCLSAVAAAAVLAFAISGCAGGSGPAGTGAGREAKGDMSATPTALLTAAPASNARTVAITFKGGKVTPVALRVELKLNQPLVLRIHADAAGQLHVHSTPQHSIDFGVGDSAVTLSFTQPGVIDIEDHALGTLIAQVEVS